MHDDTKPVRDRAKRGQRFKVALLARLTSAFSSTLGLCRSMLGLSLSSNARRLVLRSKGQFGRTMMRSQGLDPRASCHAYGVPPAR